jgi:hypothetical protein
VLLATRPHKTSTRTFWGNRMPSTRRRDTRWSPCWSCGETGYFQGNCGYGREPENDDKRRKPDERPLTDVGTIKKVWMAIEKQRNGQEGWSSKTNGCQQERTDASI